MSNLQLDDVAITDFQALYERLYGETISPDRAREIAQGLLRLYDLLLRPLPPESSTLPSAYLV